MIAEELPHPRRTRPGLARLERDGHQRSLWQDTAQNDILMSHVLPATSVDVVVVGAGITGVSTALALQEAGQRCILVEARNIGFGTTGGTSAHVNTLLELSYDRMIEKFGAEEAGMVAQAAQQAVDRIRHYATLYAPDCNWEERDAFMIALDQDQAKTLEKVVEGTRRMGFVTRYVDDAPYPGSYKMAARFEGQAQFHPTRYVHGLATAFTLAGGLLRDECAVHNVQEKDDGLEVQTDAGTIRSKRLVYATHVPPGVNILHFRNAPYRSYVLAARLKYDAQLPDALVYDMVDPYHYYRTEEVDGQRLLIAGGCDHKTGHEQDTAACFDQLEAHVRALYTLEEITHRWSSQYFEPTDGLPYIGKLPMSHDRVYVATGYGGNGMTYGTLAAIMITDMITTGGSAYEKVFDPSRVSLVAGFSNFVKEAADVVGHLAAAPFPARKLADLGELGHGEGRVVQHDGRSIAIHRDDAGTLHAVDPACSHIKCTVAWNGAERSWDCPCHGSRFAPDGSVLTAPARKPLQRVDLKNDTEPLPPS